MDRSTRVALAVLIAWPVVGGCETAKDRCEAARAEADHAWGAYIDVATPSAEVAADARDRALDEVARALMDLGNLRTHGSEEAAGALRDAYVGIEVSVGAILGAVLAARALFVAGDAEANRIADAVREELEGRYAELMTLPLDSEEARRRLHDLGDACSTRLQLLVRELPQSVRARVYDSFETLRAEEGEPDEAVTIERIRERWRAFRDHATNAQEVQARLDAAVEARESVREPSPHAREAADAVPPDSVEERQLADAASDRAFEVCSEAGL